MFLKILLLITIIYIVGCFLSYGISLAYFEYLFNKFKEEENENANIEAMAFTIALFSIVGIISMYTTKNFKWCGIKFKRGEYNNGNIKRS